MKYPPSTLMEYLGVMFTNFAEVKRHLFGVPRHLPFPGHSGSSWHGNCQILGIHPLVTGVTYPTQVG